MSLRNYLKKLGKRAAGTWGRVNHKRDMRAASKAVRKFRFVEDTDSDNLTEDPGPDKLTITEKEMFDLEDALDRFNFDDPRDYH